MKPNDFDHHWRDLCADLTDDDGRDPRDDRRRGKRKTAEQWRAHRLCGQTRRVVQLGLAACADPDLNALTVLRVEPTDGPRTLLVTLRHPGHASASLDDLHTRLAGIAPHLRAELARSIHRKRTPQLFFQIETEPSHD